MALMQRNYALMIRGESNPPSVSSCHLRKKESMDKIRWLKGTLDGESGAPIIHLFQPNILFQLFFFFFLNAGKKAGPMRDRSHGEIIPTRVEKFAHVRRQCHLLEEEGTAHERKNLHSRMI